MAVWQWYTTQHDFETFSSQRKPIKWVKRGKADWKIFNHGEEKKYLGSSTLKREVQKKQIKWGKKRYSKPGRQKRNRGRCVFALLGGVNNGQITCFFFTCGFVVWSHEPFMCWASGILLWAWSIFVGPMSKGNLGWFQFNPFHLFAFWIFPTNPGI